MSAEPFTYNLTRVVSDRPEAGHQRGALFVLLDNADAKSVTQSFLDLKVENLTMSAFLVSF